jgi:hypothetical protein
LSNIALNLLVAHGNGFTIPAYHELGIHLGDLLGDQTILRRAFPIAVEFECYWLELVQRFTGLVHRLNVMFVLPGRVEDAHRVKLIDKYCCLGARVANRLTEDAADEAGVIEGSKRTCTRCADRDAIIDACPQTRAGLVTDSHVKLPSTLLRSASSPMAVLLAPVVLFSMARSPNALFSLSVLFTSAERP